ncbi:Flp family type IVb pilin [Paraburkholderia sartisoli]|uniref:Pilus assembly protein Flp/PilA n=1 Tax=Paraburkholderia sartisoli TaxID=83784 RepID=A0A1H4HJM0_9BURK|nr:Flp family type IVb pilin [Paraburkholderia sartisoli]SEB21262.1 pilus assembly protein Flp/PilA [Paraburkholderia sartisoli]
MKNTLNLIRDFAREEDGVTAIEYGLLAALISVAIIAAVGVIGTQLNDTFTTIGTKLTNANAAG